MCARVHAFAHPWVSALGKHECYSAGVALMWRLDDNSWDLVLTFHHVGPKAGVKHHYLLCSFRSPETKSVIEPGVHSLATLADRWTRDQPVSTPPQCWGDRLPQCPQPLHWCWGSTVRSSLYQLSHLPSPRREKILSMTLVVTKNHLNDYKNQLWQNNTVLHEHVYTAAKWYLNTAITYRYN